MNRYVLFKAAVLLIPFINSAQAGVVDLVLDKCGAGPTESCIWDFDYSLQVLTISEKVSQLTPYYYGLGGVVDSDSTLSVVRNITNGTDTVWTAYILETMASIFGGGYFVSHSAASTKLQTITYPHEVYSIELTQPPPVLVGESFTIQFDFYVPYDSDTSGSFLNSLETQIIPEPASALFLAVGGLVFFRKTRKTG